MKRVYRLPDLREVGITFSDVHLRRLEEAGKFPRRFKLNPGSGPHGAVCWDTADIGRYLDSLIEARDAATELRAAEQENDEAVERDAERDGDAA